MKVSATPLSRTRQPRSGLARQDGGDTAGSASALDDRHAVGCVYRQMFRHALDIMMIFDLVRDRRGRVVDLRVRDVNPAYLRRTRRTRRAVVGRLMSELVPSSEMRRVLRIARQAVRTRRPVVREDFYLPSGRYYASVAFLLGPGRYAFAARDITAQKLAEGALRRSEREYRSLAESTSDIPYVVSTTGEVRYIGPQVRRYGFDPREIIGRSFGDFVLTADRAKTLKAFRSGVRSGRPFVLEWRARDRAGKLHWFEVSSALQRVPGARLPTITGLLREVTARRQAQDALQESMEQYRTLMETVPDMVYLCDREGRVLYVNATAARFLGLKGSRVIGRKQTELFPPAVARRHRRVIRECFDTGRPFLTPRPEYEPRRGMWIDTRLVPVRDARGRVTAVLGVTRDITALKEAEERLLSFQERLRALTHQLTVAEDEERSRLAAELHDGVGQLLALSKLKLSELKRAARADDLAARVREIEGLLETALRDTRTLTFELSPPVLHELGLAAAVDWLAHWFAARHGLQVVVLGRKARFGLTVPLRAVLFRSVRELLQNVVKHAGVKTATVSLHTSGGRLLLTVTDGGVGFRPDKVEPSTGFGLFSIRERLAPFGGTMEISSAPGRGTRVVISVPLPQSKRGVAATPLPSSTNGRRPSRSDRGRRG